MRKDATSHAQSNPLQGAYKPSTFLDSQCPLPAPGRNNKAAFIKMRSPFYLLLKNENYTHIKHGYLRRIKLLLTQASENAMF